jgi:UPF0042 nucleotide-binding protein
MNNQKNNDNSLCTASSNKELLVLIVTGLSGAGKANVIRSLEDLGFFCVDNLPVPLMFTLLNLILQTQSHVLKVALGIDARSQHFLQNFINEVQTLKQKEPFNLLKIVFLTAREDTLIKRFQETRRNHPLGQNIDLLSAIRKEQQLLEPIKRIADVIIDTDAFNIHELRRLVQQSFDSKNQRHMLVNLVSFGFKYGIPIESNLVLDLRFLPNPYFVQELKQSTGKDQAVYDYIFSKQVTQDYWDKCIDFLQDTLQRCYEEGRFFVTISIGCTGGKHRSVAFIERIMTLKIPFTNWLVQHRDIEKE